MVLLISMWTHLHLLA
ncbi:RNase H domain-containing protein, partial [Trichonephila inaurata madagascariensis]